MIRLRHGHLSAIARAAGIATSTLCNHMRNPEFFTLPNGSLKKILKKSQELGYGYTEEDWAGKVWEKTPHKNIFDVSYDKEEGPSWASITVKLKYDSRLSCTCERCRTQSKKIRAAVIRSSLENLKVGLYEGRLIGESVEFAPTKLSEIK